MKIITSVNEMQAFSDEIRGSGQKIGFVPTMGYLHEGHLSLVRAAKKDCDLTVTSIYVNPTQFGPGEDLERYPRDLDKDQSLLENERNSILFYPDSEAMYPRGFQTEVRVNQITDHLCGSSRPWHFPGVVLIVAKLFNMVKPHKAYFGQKDYQQAQVIQRMTLDFNFDIEVVVCPIVRDPDGLAMSSRNAYLSKEEREQAVVLSEALKVANDSFLEGERDVMKLKDRLRLTIQQAALAKIDYCEVVDGHTMRPIDRIDRIEGEAVAVLAAFFGKTRLIDNHILGEIFNPTP